MTYYLYMGLLLIVSYFLGSIQSGLIIGKVFKKIDIREHGSKSTGSTNAIRVLGFKYGIWAFVFDVLKGAIIIGVLKIFKIESLYMVTDNFSIVTLYGLGAVIGHVFSIFNNFKGGKAVATSLGVIFAVEPLIGVLILIGFGTVFLITRYVSLGSTVSVGIALVSFITRIFLPVHELSTITKVFDLIVLSSFGLIIVLRHRTNYQRLKEGTENKM